MDVKSATSTAKRYVEDAFGEDRVFNIGLEEIELDRQSGEWNITVGFSRPWDRPRRSPYAPPPSGEEGGSAPLSREYRIVRVSADGEVLSVRLRDIAA